MSTAQPQPPQMIPFTCPHCGHRTDVDAKFAGQSGPCVSCNNIVQVPTLQSLLRQSSSPSRSASQAKPAWIKFGMVAGGILSLGVFVVVVWSILQPAFQAARSAAQCAECETNLREIGEALEAYYSEHGEYPPAVVYGENGKPMHSWRVLILPHLGPKAQAIYEAYKMDEPWDSKHNSNYVSLMPLVYACPSDRKSLQGETSYLAIVGDNTVINRDRPTRRSAGYDGPVLRDNPSETMVILETSGSGVNWLKPQDIPVAALAAGLDSPNPASPGSDHLQGVNILMADQSILRIPPELDVSSDDLRGMATIDGGNEFIEVLDELAY